MNRINHKINHLNMLQKMNQFDDLKKTKPYNNQDILCQKKMGNDSTRGGELLIAKEIQS